jgi:hypothetical protein
MNDLLKEAIADAKAVREVALANAKLALEEAFTPRLQSMLSQKLSEEAEMDDESKEVEEEGFFNEFAMGEGEDDAEGDEHEKSMEDGEEQNDMDEYFAEADGSEEKDLEERITELEKTMAKFEGKDSEDEEEHVEEAEHTEDEKEEEDLDEDLMEIIRQLEEDLASSEIGKGDNKKPSAKASDDSTQDPAASQKVVQLVEEEDEEKVDEAKDDDEDVNEILRAIREEDGDEEKMDESSELDINEILRALREEEDDEEEKVDEAKDDDKDLEEANAKLREAYAVITFLRSKINEVNLLNSKLLFTNKIFKKHALSENQKITVIENFDRASSLREVKLVFATLSEALKSAKTNIKPLKESFASKPIASTRPKTIINEGDDMASRLRKLAGLK